MLGVDSKDSASKGRANTWLKRCLAYCVLAGGFEPGAFQGAVGKLPGKDGDGNRRSVVCCPAICNFLGCSTKLHQKAGLSRLVEGPRSHLVVTCRTETYALHPTASSYMSASQPLLFTKQRSSASTHSKNQDAQHLTPNLRLEPTTRFTTNLVAINNQRSHSRSCR